MQGNAMCAPCLDPGSPKKNNKSYKKTFLGTLGKFELAGIVSMLHFLILMLTLWLYKTTSLEKGPCSIQGKESQLIFKWFIKKYEFIFVDKRMMRQMWQSENNC